MKKIIGGRKYDTETATFLDSTGTLSLSRSDFNFWRECLYRKKNGEFFLFGEGHGMSKYAKQNGNCSSWGETIIPLTKEQAESWAEKNLDGEEYEAIFGEIAE